MSARVKIKSNHLFTHFSGTEPSTLNWSIIERGISAIIAGNRQADILFWSFDILQPIAIDIFAKVSYLVPKVAGLRESHKARQINDIFLPIPSWPVRNRKWAPSYSSRGRALAQRASNWSMPCDSEILVVVKLNCFCLASLSARLFSPPSPTNPLNSLRNLVWKWCNDLCCLTLKTSLQAGWKQSRNHLELLLQLR